MRLIIDIQFYKPNQAMLDALAEIIQLHDRGVEMSHDVYDIAMAALPSYRRSWFWKAQA